LEALSSLGRDASGRVTGAVAKALSPAPLIKPYIRFSEYYVFNNIRGVMLVINYVASGVEVIVVPSFWARISPHNFILVNPRLCRGTIKV